MDERHFTTNKKTSASGIKQRFDSYLAVLFGKDKESDALFETSKLRKALLLKILCFTVSFLFTQCTLMFETKPLALAFCCGISGNLAIFAFIGAVFGSFFLKEGMLVQIVCITLALVGRLLLRYAPGGKGLFREPAIVKAALAAALSFILALYDLIASDFSFHSLYALIFTLIFVPIFSVVFSLALERDAKPLLKDAGACLLLYFTVYALNVYGLFGLSLGVVVSVFVTLCIGATSGALRAAVTGALCGVACGTSFVAPLSLLGLTAGLFAGANIVFAVSCAIGASVLLSLYVQGYSAVFTFAGDALLSSLLFLPLYKTGYLPKFNFFESAENAKNDKTVTEKKKYEKSKLSALSEAFDSLSDELLEMSEGHRMPSESDYREICDSIFRRRCMVCKNYSLCQSQRGDLSEFIKDSLSKQLSEGGRIDINTLPGEFLEFCHFSEDILFDISESAANALEAAIKRDKTEILALDYEAMSELLGVAASDGENEFEQDSELLSKAIKVIRSLGISAVGFSARGTREKTITASGISIGSLGVGTKEIKAAFEKECMLPFGEPKFDFSGDYVTMTIKSRPRIETEAFSLSDSKENEAYCGDAVKVFDGCNNVGCAVICDGMGSGRMASITAKVSSVFLEKMLGAGNRKNTVLKMLSNFIRSKSEECTCTIDLLEIDKYTSEAVFTKCAAEASYILREDKLFTLEARSLPIGVTKSIDPEEKRIKLLPGDLIIMTSDGALQSPCEILSTQETLDQLKSASCEDIASMILAKAKQTQAQEGTSDDSSVIVIKIKSVS